MTLGSLVIGEQTLPIARIELTEGKICFWIDHDGPLDLPADDEVCVRAPDDSLIAAAPWRLSERDRYRLRSVSTDEVAHVAFPLAIADVLRSRRS